MRVFFLTVFASLAAALSAPIASAQEPTLIYSEPTQVNMGGRPVTADIDLYTNPSDTITVLLVTDITKFIVETQEDLKAFVASRYNRCGERLQTSDPIIEFPADRIRFRLDLDYEVWNCGLLGDSEPRRVIRETIDLDVKLLPQIEDGKLQAYLDSFSLGERTGLNQFLPVETILQKIIESNLRTLNKNPKFYRAPQPFHREGFAYDAIRADLDGDQVIITATYSADGDAATLDRLTASLRDDGIISER